MNVSTRQTMELLEQKHRKAVLGKHNQLDFFVANVVDASPKSDQHSMEHPMFSLSKKPDTRERHYEHNGCSITITPSVKGLATIWDKDVLIYCASQIIAALNRDEKVSRTVRTTAYDMLKATSRGTGGKSYDRLVAALDRLRGTNIKTDIKTNGVCIREGFGLLDKWRVVEKEENDPRMEAIEITLSEWLFNALTGREVLTFNHDYFRITGGLERRLYELARKHCGDQESCPLPFKLETLYKKSGSSGTLRQFRNKIKKIAEADGIPDYHVEYDSKNDKVSLRSRDVFYASQA